MQVALVNNKQEVLQIITQLIIVIGAKNTSTIAMRKQIDNSELSHMSEPISWQYQ